jgi:hypothetical protein
VDIEHIIKVLDSAGYKYLGFHEDKETISCPAWEFEKKEFLSGPACKSNGRPPVVRIRIYSTIVERSLEDSVEVSIVGYRDMWTEVKVYGFHYNEIAHALPEIEKRLKRMWKAFFFISE